MLIAKYFCIIAVIRQYGYWVLVRQWFCGNCKVFLYYCCNKTVWKVFNNGAVAGKESTSFVNLIYFF